VTLVLLAAPDLRAAVEVRVSGERVDVQATNAPLSEILEGLSRQAHIKLVYEGPPPRQLLSVDLKDRTPAEAVLAILEGQGVGYAVALDRSGTRVETLLMAGGNPAPASSTAPLPPPPPERRIMREPAVEEPLEEGSAEEEPQVPPDTGRAVAPQVKASEAPAPSPGVFLPAPAAADFPTSAFAPKPPAPEPVKSPKPESTPPPFNP